ncbi:uroporphyrinogen decarboxylase [Actinopolyspora biskrensis]|uniref:Uroporphyrinogen decarboxylase n=1 Tax=Actinopolyspora biskrensis TaxID=1470178 RepID=A0A852YVD2_9ACTN|nr:uroporphyrinogen decarboxylase [Actinopolyspora biskrensis]NYH76815.1 uroporphyrinogen decarboxylase [Actinopolyspora biskrensis]
MSLPANVSNRRQLDEAPLLVAARGGTPAHTPVWFMRQAGRSLPEYRRTREGVPMLRACLTPDLVSEITMQPVRRHGVDAAILFSDIVLPLYASGVELDIVAGTGPVVNRPVRGAADVAALPALRAEQVEGVAEAVRTLVAELGATPLIGFAGAPFTLASYLVEGGPSRNHERTKALMHSEPETWHALLGKLAETTLEFLRVQIDAGVDAVQLFDSWAGALSPHDYAVYVQPHTNRILRGVAEHSGEEVPRIHFGVGTGELLTAMRDSGASVVGVDWRVPLDRAVNRLDPQQHRPPVVQGNLDPAVLFAGWDAVRSETERVLAEGRSAGGHIFNLGHGVLPDTDPDVLTRIVELVHSSSAGRR